MARFTGQIGRLRHRVDIQRKKTEYNEIGEPKDAWTTIHHNVPAEIRGMGGREAFDSDQVDATSSHTIMLRYIDGIVPEMRILHGDQIFNIEASNDPDGYRRRLRVSVMELHRG